MTTSSVRATDSLRRAPAGGPARPDRPVPPTRLGDLGGLARSARRDRPVEVCLVGESELVRAGIVDLLGPHRGRVRLHLVHHSRVGRAEGVDVVLRRPHLGIDRHLGDGVRVGAVGWDSSPFAVWQALADGAHAFLSHQLDGPALADALVAISAGGRRVEDARGPGVEVGSRWTSFDGRAGLTPRESEVLFHVCSGAENSQISHRMFVTANTVKSYIRSAYHKIGVSRRADAVRWCLRPWDLLEADDAAAG